MKLWAKGRQSFVGSFMSAFRGLRFALEGRNFIVTIILGLSALLLSYPAGLAFGDRIVIIISTGTILGAEIFNTAMEQMLDILIPHHDPRVGKIKDLLAGGVLVFSGIALTIWVRLFLQAFFGPF